MAWKYGISGPDEVEWDNVLHKPSTFNSTSHSHVVTDVTGLSTVATSGAYSDLSGKPTLSTVATSGSYNDLSNKPTIPTVRRVETYLGTTNASGNYTVVYSQAFPTTPDVQPQTQAGVANQSVLITASTTTGFTIQVVVRASINILGSDVLLASVTPVNGASVSVLVTARE